VGGTTGRASRGTRASCRGAIACAPDGEVGGVDDAVVVAISREAGAGLGDGFAPEHIVGAVDDAVLVVVAEDAGDGERDRGWCVGEVEVEAAGEGGKVESVEGAVDAAGGGEDVERLAWEWHEAVDQVDIERAAERDGAGDRERVVLRSFRRA